MREIIGAIAAIFIIMLMLPMFNSYQQQGVTNIKMRHAADHMQQVNHAVTGYVRAHYDTLLTQSTATAGPELTVQELIDDGQLPTGFGAINVWGQTYNIYIRQPKTDELEAITLSIGGDTSGRDFATVTIPSTASLLGGAGGFIPSGLIPGQSVDTLQGAFNGWTLGLASMGITSPGPGHLGARSAFDASSLSLDFLYRMAVPGHEELNSMFTELDMRDNAIRNVQELQFESHTAAELPNCDGADQDGRVFLDAAEGLYVCRDGKTHVLADSGNSLPIKNATVVPNGALIDKPLCASGTNSEAQIFVAPSIASANSPSPPLASFQAWPTTESDTQWRVHLRVLRGDGKGWVYPSSNYGRVMAMTLCAQKNP